MPLRSSRRRAGRSGWSHRSDPGSPTDRVFTCLDPVSRESAFTPGGSLPPHSTLQLAEQALEELSLPTCPPPDLAARLAELAEILAEWSQRVDLTSHRGPEAILRKLIAPALALRSVIPQARSLADLGSGAGIPGLPLAILDPALRVTLIESRERRHHFQRHVVRTLAISNATPRLGRAESLVPDLHEAVVSQAVGSPEKAVGWALRWVLPGGRILIPGGSASLGLGQQGIERAQIGSLHPPLGEPERRVWVGTRTARAL